MTPLGHNERMSIEILYLAPNRCLSQDSHRNTQIWHAAKLPTIVAGNRCHKYISITFKNCWLSHVSIDGIPSALSMYYVMSGISKCHWDPKAKFLATKNWNYEGSILMATSTENERNYYIRLCYDFLCFNYLIFDNKLLFEGSCKYVNHTTFACRDLNSNSSVTVNSLPEQDTYDFLWVIHLYVKIVDRCWLNRRLWGALLLGTNIYRDSSNNPNYFLIFYV